MTITDQAYQDHGYRLVIVDRDGVLNYDSDHYIKSAHEWQAIPGSFEALARWYQSGILLGMASNQSGVVRGLFSQSDLDHMHAKLCQTLENLGGRFHYAHYCLDDPDQPTDFRKPGPGMLLEALRVCQIPRDQALFIGDSYTDYQAAQRAGIDFALVQTGKGARTLSHHPALLRLVPVFGSLDQVSLQACWAFSQEQKIK